MVDSTNECSTRESRGSLRAVFRFFPVLAIFLAVSGVAVAQGSDTRGEWLRGPASYPEYVDRWAVIVGITKYEHEGLNLQYAHRDAQALYELLLKPSGGAFAPDHVVKLIDEEATTAGVTRALRTFLKRPAKEDIVLLYFAAHGMPDPERPNNVYLLTHDTDPDDISGTALPMREVQASLRENLLAERVILLADTCHSASVGGLPGTRGGDRAAVVNRYLEEVSRTRPGMALMTSAEANEVALEDERWGGGHGVFSHYILQGMRGEADRVPRDGVVSVGELFDYVRDRVEEATDNRQHPSIGQAPFDRELPVAITGGATAHELLRLGTVLYDLGLKLDDRRRLESARAQFAEAMRLSRASGQSMPDEAQVRLGRVLLDLDEPEAARVAFSNALREGAANEVAADARFFLALAHIRQAQAQEAKDAFQGFLGRHAKDERAPWVRDLLQQVSRGGVRRALLIGVGKIRGDEGLSLAGPENDVRLMGELLGRRLGFGHDEVAWVIDEVATAERIQAELDRLAEVSSPSDSVMVYYSGHASVDDPIVPHDYPDARISADDLDRLFRKIPTRSKTLILDMDYGLCVSATWPLGNRLQGSSSRT